MPNEQISRSAWRPRRSKCRNDASQRREQTNEPENVCDRAANATAAIDCCKLIRKNKNELRKTKKPGSSAGLPQNPWIKCRCGQWPAAGSLGPVTLL
jgi:hypothetical protein